MPVLLQDMIRRVRADLDEPAYPTLPNSTASVGPLARLYSDTELTDWINDGSRDVARRAEVLLTVDTSITIPAYGENPHAPPPTYPLNLGVNPATGTPPNGPFPVSLNAYSDVIRINRVEFQVANDSSQIYPLEPASPQYLDNIWNIDQLSTMSYPAYYTTRGFPGGTGRSALSIQLFPNPGQAGQLNVWYYRLPVRFQDPVANPASYTNVLDLIEGWDDMVIDYAVMRGMLKARNPDWEIRQKLYEEKMEAIINQTRHFHDQPQYMTYDTMVMPWAFDSWGGF